MKKLFLFFTILLMLSSFVLAEDVAYVVRNDVYGVDQNIINELVEGGYSYEVLDDSDIPLTDFSEYELILVKEDIPNAPVNDFKSIVINENYYEDWSSDVGSVGSNQQLEAMNNFERSIGDGLPSVFPVYDSCCYSSGPISLPMYYLIGQKTGSEGAIFTINNLGQFAVATKESPRRVFFGITETDYWNSNSEALFRDSIQWLMEGEDRDGDGFYSEDDCNDRDSSINPNSNDIPYDGIDQDCDGSDFRDVDGDGYDSDSVGGEDCNDQDPFINPEAIEIIDNIDQNCVNDAPFLKSGDIADIVMEEDAPFTLIINTFFSDPEGDDLTFSLNSSSSDDEIVIEFEEDRIHFTHEENWHGEGWAIFEASDGENQVTTNNISIEVLPVNDNPVIEQMDDISIVEGGIIDIDPVATDVDLDNLTFSFSAPLNSEGVWQTTSDDIGTTNVEITVNDGQGGIDTEFISLHVIQKILINEVELNPESSDSGKEWVELFNPRGNEISLEGYSLVDEAGNEVNLSGAITDYFVHTYSSSTLNNADEMVYLYKEGIIVDQTPSLSDSNNDFEDWQRVPNGFDANSDSDWTFQRMTKGFDNDADAYPAEVSLISPINGSLSVEKVINFSYSATDNVATQLVCYFYTDISGSFMQADSEQIDNGTSGNFRLQGLEDGTYLWNVECFDGASRAFGEDNFTFIVDAPDAPVLEDISNVQVNEGDLISITANADDADNDALTYSIDNSNFVKNSNNFAWQTDFNDAGVYTVTVNVSDGSLFDEKSFVITINDINQPPVIDPISDLEVAEDSGFTLGNPLTGSDVDGEIVRFDIISEDLTKVNCDSTDGVLGVTPAENWNGVGDGAAQCTIQAVDNLGATGTYTLKVNVTPVNDAPMITSFSPTGSPLIAEDGTKSFGVTWEDPDSEPIGITVEWYRDGVLGGIGENYIFIGDGSSKAYNITVVVGDNDGGSSQRWNLTTSNIPITNKYDGDTTNFTGMDNSDLASVFLILERVGHGKIEFLEPVDMRNIVDLDSNTFIEAGFAGIDTTVFTTLANKIARITFYNLGFTKTPTIYHNPIYLNNPDQVNSICPNGVCSDINYSNNELVFNTSSFSTFKVGDVLSCSQQGGFICGGNQVCGGSLIEAVDSNSCCSTSCVPGFNAIDRCENPNSNIVIDIKEPDSGDDFNIDDIIDGEVEIENNLGDKRDFDLEIILYDQDEDDKLEKEKDNIKVKDGKDENVDFELEIPSDADARNRHYVFIVAEDEDDSDICNEAFIEVELEREDDHVIIENFEFPGTAKAGDFIDVRVDVANIGEDDQDVYIEISNQELGITERSDEFELEEFDEDDEETRTFSIKVPEGVESGDYDLTATVVYGNDRDSESKNLKVGRKGSSSGVISLGTTSLGEAINLNGRAQGAIALSGKIPPKVEADSFVLTKEEEEIPEIGIEFLEIHKDAPFDGLSLKIERVWQKYENLYKGYDSGLGHKLAGIALILGCGVIAFAIVVLIILRRR